MRSCSLVRPGHLVWLGLVTLFLSVNCDSKRLLADTIFAVGNSLTWDAKPQDLDGDVDYHIFCGRNLQYIYDNPLNHCVDTSTPWTVALQENQYDWLVVQPFAGTTLQQDASIIESWLQMQPSAKLVIHPGWTRFANFPDDYLAGNPDNKMRPNPAYINALITELHARVPNRDIRTTRSHDLLFSVWEDTQKGIGPFSSLDDLARDEIHMGHNSGRYLMHNALRRALGQPISGQGFNTPTEFRSYFDGKLTAIPEPSVLPVLFLAGVALSQRRARRTI